MVMRLPLQHLLQGNWRLARRITSLHDGAELGAVILGTASFLPVAEAPLDLLYREAGQVQLPGHAPVSSPRWCVMRSSQA